MGFLAHLLAQQLAVAEAHKPLGGLAIIIPDGLSINTERDVMEAAEQVLEADIKNVTRYNKKHQMDVVSHATGIKKADVLADVQDFVYIEYSAQPERLVELKRKLLVISGLIEIDVIPPRQNTNVQGQFHTSAIIGLILLLFCVMLAALFSSGESKNLHLQLIAGASFASLSTMIYKRYAERAIKLFLLAMACLLLIWLLQASFSFIDQFNEVLIGASAILLGILIVTIICAFWERNQFFNQTQLKK